MKEEAEKEYEKKFYVSYTHKHRNIKKNSFILKLDEFRLEIQRRDQEIMSMAAKLKTLEEQHQVWDISFNFFLFLSSG